MFYIISKSFYFYMLYVKKMYMYLYTFYFYIYFTRYFFKKNHRCRRGICGRFLVSVFDAVSGESLAELHHSGARLARADAASSSLFFLAAVLARSGQVLRWRLNAASSGTTREHPPGLARERCVTMTGDSVPRRNIITGAPRELFYYRDGSGHEGQRGSVLR